MYMAMIVISYPKGKNGGGVYKHTLVSPRPLHLRLATTNKLIKLLMNVYTLYLVKEWIIDLKHLSHIQITHLSHIQITKVRLT